RVEGYDVSNIQGKQATGAMVVFEKGLPNKAEYKKFKIKTLKEPNDVGMLKEILTRRLNHPEWKRPQVVLIDGGKAQLNVALKLKMKNKKLKAVKIMSLAKKNNELFVENRKKPLLLKDLPQEISNLILQIRDEAHRFAITYHKKLRSKNFLQK
ncbi:excinuclease ABC subunit C, partial [Candidatus Parcubacteria bacterium]|nr:excinuclease ABC subunit C [Candidatus Parcubacteria bacterium]